MGYESPLSLKKLIQDRHAKTELGKSGINQIIVLSFILADNSYEGRSSKLRSPYTLLFILVSKVL